MSMVVAYVIEMTVKTSCVYGEYGPFEYLLFFSSLLLLLLLLLLLVGWFCFGLVFWSLLSKCKSHGSGNHHRNREERIQSTDEGVMFCSAVGRTDVAHHQSLLDLQA